MTTPSSQTPTVRLARLFLAAVASLALVAAGCGSDDGEATDAGDATETAETESSDTSDEAESSDDASTETSESDDEPADESSTTVSTEAPAVDFADAATVTVLDQGAEPRTELRLQIEPGQAEVMVIDQVQEISQEIGGQQAPSIGAIGMTIEQQLTASPAGDGLLTYTSLVTSATVADDTNPLIAGELQTALDGMTGISTSAVVDDRGRVLNSEVDGLEAIDPTVANTMEQLTNNSQFAHPLPEEPVGVGAMWEVTQVLELNGLEVEQVTSYELLSIDGTVVELALGSNQVVEAGDQLEAEGVTATVVSWEGISSGSITYDLTSMVPTSTVQLVANQSLEFGPGAESTVLDQSIETTISVSRG